MRYYVVVFEWCEDGWRIVGPFESDQSAQMWLDKIMCDYEGAQIVQLQRPRELVK